MIAMISRPLAALAALGWASSLGLSVASIVGAPIPTWSSDALLIGLFPLSLAGIVMFRLAQDGHYLTFRRAWQAASDRAPSWVRHAALAGWICVVGVMAASWLGLNLTREGVSLAVLSALYAFPLVALWTTSRSVECANGHRVGAFNPYCRECGAPVVDNWPA